MFRKIIYGLFAAALLATGAAAQHLVVGEKAPDIRVKEWHRGVPSNTAKAVLLDFFHSANDQCVRALPGLNDIQKNYAGRLSVIVIQKEAFSKTAPHIDGKGYSFYPALDDEGKTFSAYDVRFVPFSVLIDRNGRVAWAGNVNNLTVDVIDRALQ